LTPDEITKNQIFCTIQTKQYWKGKNFTHIERTIELHNQLELKKNNREKEHYDLTRHQINCGHRGHTFQRIYDTGVIYRWNFY
jgi:hypothetical protein